MGGGEHVLFANEPFALQIITYYDDIEVLYPLGLKRMIVGNE